MTAQWHIIHNYADGDDSISEIFHPHSCPWSVIFHPRMIDTDGNLVCETWTERRYDCEVTFEHDQAGMNRFPVMAGWFKMRVTNYTTRIGESQWLECNSDVEWQPLAGANVLNPEECE